MSNGPVCFRAMSWILKAINLVFSSNFLIYGLRFKLWAEPRLTRFILLRFLMGQILLYSGCGMDHIFCIIFPMHFFYKVIFSYGIELCFSVQFFIKEYDCST